MASRDVGVILAAAGSGERYGRPKQLEAIGELKVYQHVVRTFSAIEPVRSIVVVARASDVAEFEEGLRALSPPCEWHVVAGGETRQQSVANGFRKLREDDQVSIVLVHD